MDTSQLIKDAFISLYSKTDYNKITVKALCEAVPIARTTFYSHYQNIDEIKSELERETIEGIRSACEDIYSGDTEKYFSLALKYIEEHREIFFAFLVAQPNWRFISKFKNAIIIHFKDNFKDKIRSKNYELELEIFASGVVSFYTYILKHPDEVDVKALGKKFSMLVKFVDVIF